MLRPILLTLALVTTLTAADSVSFTGAPLKQPLTLTPETLAAMSRARVTRTANGVDTVYEGVWISTLIKTAGIPLSPELHGKVLASYILASAEDGYQALFAIGEFEPSLGNNDVLLADTVDGKPASGKNGRFCLVAAKEKRAARSIRMLKSLEVVQVAK